MTFREKLADWISGGKLSERQKDYEYLFRRFTLDQDKRKRYYRALSYIVSQDTPHSNSTVKRMVGEARKAMKYEPPF